MVKAKAGTTAPASKLGPLLSTLTQGDLLTLGAVSVVGRGLTKVVSAAGGKPSAEEIWSVTFESDLGWYVIVSGACDIARDASTEPCIAVAPITVVTQQRYQQLRSGEYSPREFPLPAAAVGRVVGASNPDDFWPVVDLRYITSVDKLALLSNDVESRRPLTGPQQKRFSSWIGRRFNRPTDSDQLEQHVLGNAGTKVSKLAEQFASSDNPKSLPLEVRLVGAAREWLIGGTERHVEINVVLNAKSTQEAGLYDLTNFQIDQTEVVKAAGKLAKVLANTLATDSGCVLTVKPITLDGINAGEYLALEQWLWADVVDPLAV